MSEETAQISPETRPDVEVLQAEVVVEDNTGSQESNDDHASGNNSPFPTKISSGTPPRSQYVRLRGLPFNATEKDIHEFFSGLPIERVKFVCTTGRPNGEAYVEFKKKEDSGKAMEFDRKEISNRYIEVFSATASEAEFEFRPDPDSNGEENHVVRLRGLPWSCKEDDIRQFFDGLEPPPAEIVIGGTGGPKSRPSGEAFVRFTSQDATEKAMEYNNRHLGSRYVEVFMSSMVEFNRAKGGGGFAGTYERSGIRPLMSLDRSGSGYGPGRGGNSYGSGGYGAGHDEYSRGGYGRYQDQGYNGEYDQGGYVGDYRRGSGDEPLRVYMRGLPYDADHHAIEAFFSPLRCHSIKLGINETGRPSGDAIAEFDNYGDVQAALSKNNQRMGRRYVELFDHRGAPGPMRRLLWKETTGPNALASPAPDSLLNGGKRNAVPPRDTGYRSGPQAVLPSHREARDPYGPRQPRGYEREREPRGPPSRAPARAPLHGRAEPWGAYGASSATGYEQSAAGGYSAGGWDAYYTTGGTQPAYSSTSHSSYPSAAHSAYDTGRGASAYPSSSSPAYDRPRESRDLQTAWNQYHQHQSTYGGWGAGAGDHRGGY